MVSDAKGDILMRIYNIYNRRLKILLCVTLAFFLLVAACANRSYTAAYLYNPGEFDQLRLAAREDAARAEKRLISDDTVYLYLPNISPDVRRFVVGIRGELARFERLILDLRGNYGGQLAEAYRIADMFLNDGDIIGYESGRFPFLDREIVARGGRAFEFESIVIIQNAGTASAAESLILALIANLDNVTLVGETTFGKGSAQIVLPLRDGYSMIAPVLTLSGPGGESIDTAGIAPNIEYTGVETMLDFVLALKQ